MSLGSCEKCGAKPALARDFAVKDGRVRLAALCADCLAAQVRQRLVAVGGAALAALAATAGAALLVDRLSRREGGRSPQQAFLANRFRTPLLNAFSRDLTQLADEGKLDPVIGRDAHIDRVVRILARRTKNNPVLIGEAGVGKTAIVEGLARRIAAGSVPGALKGRRIVQLSLAGVVAGTKYRGEFEARLNRILDEVRRASDEVMLFIDELHTIVGAGSAEGSTVDAANILKPELARGDIRCIGATTSDEYRRHIESDAALERRFQPVVIEEPTPEETIAMLRGLRERYEAHHGVVISDEALSDAVRLSARYIADRRLPDKAFDLVDEAAAMVALRGSAAVLPADVARVVSGWTGIPLETLEAAEALRLVNFEDVLRERVVGQNDAVVAVAECVRRARAGLKEARGPMGALLFVGPSGVGKTELARATAHALFGSDDALLRLDMSEFAQPHSAARLLGVPPGYAGGDRAGELTEAVRRRPYSVVLFDEVEKAHPEVLDLLLQLLDDGRLTDAHSRTVSFRNALVILTSNLPAGAELSALGMSLSSEIVNRLDEVVLFRPLGPEDLRAIARLQVRPLVASAAEQGVDLRVSDAALAAIAQEADDPRQGARMLRRIVEKRLRSPLARALLSGKFAKGGTVLAECDQHGGITLSLCDTSF